MPSEKGAPMEITPELISAILLVLGFIVALTPTEKDDKVLGRLKNLYKKFRGKK